jgi:TnpA family transposase
LLLEINARTGFAREMLSHTASLMGSTPQETVDLETSLIAVLVAEACNIGLPAVTDEKNVALKASRLAWVKQTYLQADVITHGNAKLVDYHSSLPVVQHWGGGEIASSDGQRFVVPVKSLYSGLNSKYFGSKRGITYYTLISDQFTQLHGQVISGTVKDSLFILANLLEQVTSVKPTEVMSDTGGYSDVIFGLFHLLGFKFSPRLKDLKKLRYWRINARANYGQFEEISRNKISTVRIADHWDDIVRLVGSLKLGKVKAPDILRVLARDGKLGGLGNAVAEIGRVAKTMFLLEYHNDEGYRRKITAQLNRGESRHSLVEAVLHGEKGEIRRHYKRGMESQLGALGFVVNTIILWNTEYVGAILGLLEAMGVDVLEEDVARVSPVRWAHVNMLGRYEFNMDPAVAGGDLRPLRDPDSVRFLDGDS